MVVSGRWRAREGVAIILSDVKHSAVIYFRCVTSRILWIEFKFSRVRVCVTSVMEMLKKETVSGTTWTGFWIEYKMDIDCAFWEI